MTMRVFAILIGLLGVGLFHAPARGASDAPQAPRARARLLAEHQNLAPGKRAWLALEFAIEPGWHMYWKGQNDTGMPPQLEFELPDGYSVSEVQWPAPERHIAPGGLVDSILHEQMTLLIGVDVPVNAKVGTSARLGVKAEWLVCQEACVMEDAAFKVTLPVRDAMPAAQPDPKATGVFAAARERLPKKLPKEEPPAKVEWRGDKVTIDAPGASLLVFHPEEDAVAMQSPLKEGETKGSRLQFGVKQPKGDQQLRGVLEIRKGDSKPEYYQISVSKPAPAGSGS